MIEVRVKRILVSGGEAVDLPPAGVTCILGGNNVGKSQLLREINAHFTAAEQAPALVTREVEIIKPHITSEDVQEFLDTRGVKHGSEPGQRVTYTSEHGGQHLGVAEFLAHYTSGSGFLATSTFFVWYASAGSLLGIASASAATGMDAGSTPINKLFRDGDLEAELSALSSETFGIPLTLDRINSEARLRVGATALTAPPFDHPTREYADAVAALPDLAGQGDGIKSFLGLAISVLVGTSQVLLVDEPEAFLHPSQARALGRWLALQAVKSGIQVILSTHDRDLLLGLVEAGKEGAVNILRITRNETVNHLHHLPPNEVAKVWKDPVLRYSNVLQGLFHRRVVICEGDADCRFYGAVLDVLAQEANRRAQADDTLLVPSGGKQRIATMVAALAGLGVDTWAIVDFDIFRKRDDLKMILHAKNLSWTDDMDQDYIALSGPINEKQLWNSVKNLGLVGVPPGSAHTAATSLMKKLRDAGILVVQVGEMEDHDKNIDLHGAGWVSAMLENDAHRSCTAVHDLVRPLIDS